MQRYELLYIVPQNVADTEIAALTSQITEKVRGAGATIVREDHLGKKRLAYEIKKSTHGSYELVQFDMGPEHVKPLEQSLKLMHEILRYQIIKIPTKSEEQLARERALQEKLAKQMAHAIRPETPAEPVVKAEPAPAPQLSTEELSKKLDELLEKPEI